MALGNGAPLIVQQSSPSWPLYPHLAPVQSKKETKCCSTPKKGGGRGLNAPKEERRKEKESEREEARHFANLENISQYRFRLYCP